MQIQVMSVKLTNINLNSANIHSVMKRCTFHVFYVIFVNVTLLSQISISSRGTLHKKGKGLSMRTSWHYSSVPNTPIQNPYHFPDLILSSIVAPPPPLSEAEPPGHYLDGIRAGLSEDAVYLVHVITRH